MNDKRLKSGCLRRNSNKKGLDKRMKIKWLDENCNICDEQLNSWDARLSKTLAYKNKVCEKCIANEYDMDVEALRTRMEDYYGMRPCQGL